MIDKGKQRGRLREREGDRTRGNECKIEWKERKRERRVEREEREDERRVERK